MVNKAVSPTQFRIALTQERDFKFSVVLVSIISIAGGCVAGLQPSPPKPYHGQPWEAVVLLDADFSPAETGQVVLGFDTWEQTLGKQNVHVRFGQITHANAISSSAPGNWIYVIRAGKSIECDGKGKAGCWRGDTRHIELAADGVTPQQLFLVATHELGHAMGLEHCPSKKRPACAPPATMAENTGGMTPVPETQDIEEFCRINGCTMKLGI